MSTAIAATSSCAIFRSHSEYPRHLKAKVPEQPWQEIAAIREGATMRIIAKGQVTIPKGVRERAGLMPGTDVEFEIEAGVVRLVEARAGGRRRNRGQRLVESLRGRGDFKMTTDEIVALMRPFRLSGPPFPSGGALAFTERTGSTVGRDGAPGADPLPRAQGLDMPPPP